MPVMPIPTRLSLDELAFECKPHVLCHRSEEELTGLRKELVFRVQLMSKKLHEDLAAERLHGASGTACNIADFTLSILRVDTYIRLARAKAS